MGLYLGNTLGVRMKEPFHTTHWLIGLVLISVPGIMILDNVHGKKKKI